MNVADVILATGRADAPALIYGDTLLSYGQLRSQVDICAAALERLGLDRGERIGIAAENGFFFVTAYFGILRAGLCAVPIPSDYSAEAVAGLAAATQMRLILASRRSSQHFQQSLAGSTTAVTVEHDFAGDVAPLAPPAGVAPMPAIELAAIMPTSGSTGPAKGVMVTHRNIECNARDIIDYMGFSPIDRALVVLPLYYCYGVSLLHSILMAGGSLVLDNRFMFPEKVLDTLEQNQCSGMAGVPSTYQILLRKTRFAQRCFPRLRWLQQAGGRLPNPFLREMRTAFPAVRIFVMYGQTEATARLSYLPPNRLDDKLGSIGRGLPHVKLEVLRPDGTPVTGGSKEVGEIVASGESITPGYWNDPAETTQYFRNGKLYTGDMAHVDSDGFIFLVDRARDFIKPMGTRVSPKEIEEVIAELPAVVEVAVIGMPHELWGEAAWAWITTALPGQLSAEEVRRHCLSRLANHKVPERVLFLGNLPKTANGKVAKDTLRRLAREQVS